jgi:hydroxyacylglutathione hydrolase
MTDSARQKQTRIRIEPINAFTDNYIWLIEDGKHAVVVDPGQAEPVLHALKAAGLTLTAILLTHHHQDHVGGVKDILKQWVVPVYGPAMEELPVCDHRLSQGDRVSLTAPHIELQVLDVPGHTAGHIAYTGQIDGEPVLFCGDTLFVGGCGRVFEGTPAQMLESLDKLAALPEQTQVYCAHEYTLSNLRWALTVDAENPALIGFEHMAIATRQANQPTVPSQIGLEKRCNPFLRTRIPSVVKAASEWAGHTLDGPVEVFAALRNWKNGFK